MSSGGGDDGGDLFWRAFTLRACTYVASHYTDRLKDYEQYIKKASELYNGAGRCPDCLFKYKLCKEVLIKCANCSITLACGKKWCDSTKRLNKTCSICNVHLCEACFISCSMCITKICTTCTIHCRFCKSKTCRDHVNQCDLCMKFLFCPCMEHECVKRIKK